LVAVLAAFGAAAFLVVAVLLADFVVVAALEAFGLEAAVLAAV
jgi:hypothetical protein